MDVRYSDLQDHPVETLARIYTGLGCTHFSSVQPGLEAYLASLSGYRKNRFASLTPAEQEAVASRWEFAFQAFGYAPHSGVGVG